MKEDDEMMLLAAGSFPGSWCCTILALTLRDLSGCRSCRVYPIEDRVVWDPSPYSRNSSPAFSCTVHFLWTSRWRLMMPMPEPAGKHGTQWWSIHGYDSNTQFSGTPNVYDERFAIWPQCDSNPHDWSRYEVDIGANEGYNQYPFQQRHSHLS